MLNSQNCGNFLSQSFLDYPDNSSISVVFYMPGCDRNCKGCQNDGLKQFVGYEDFDKITDYIEKMCSKEHTDKLCLQGGDPLYVENLPFTRFILLKLGHKLDICIYTGATIDTVKSLNLEGFKYIKCGVFDASRYVGSEKTNNYIRFATTNQELYDKDFNLVSKNGIYYF